MSELKATTVYDAYWKANSVGEGTGVLVYLKSEADKVIAEKDAEIATLKKEVSRQKRLRCYNLKMWCSAERFTHRGRTIPEDWRWWERHFYSVCRVWEKFREANK